MAILRTVVKLGLAKKLIDELRKPQNQRRIKALVASAKAKRSASRRRPGP
ncbi:MAG: hypothetical protein H0U61_00295 [Nocardioidaceae bacterium]|nr:hypothetical protein [Nocardioidaceae bacterium]